MKKACYFVLGTLLANVTNTAFAIEESTDLPHHSCLPLTRVSSQQASTSSLSSSTDEDGVSSDVTSPEKNNDGSQRSLNLEGDITSDRIFCNEDRWYTDFLLCELNLSEKVWGELNKFLDQLFNSDLPSDNWSVRDFGINLADFETEEEQMNFIDKSYDTYGCPRKD